MRILARAVIFTLFPAQTAVAFADQLSSAHSSVWIRIGLLLIGAAFGVWTATLAISRRPSTESPAERMG
jgi:polyisoprenoid-binding protein YceI